MNRFILMVGLLFILLMPQAWGATTQYPDPNRQTMWNNMTDSVNTMGQTPLQAKYTKRRLHAQRARARINSIQQARRQAIINSDAQQ